MRRSTGIDFQAERKTILRVHEGHALELRDRQGDVEWVDDEIEDSRELPLDPQKAHPTVESDAP
jgi:hypothetical protein